MSETERIARILTESHTIAVVGLSSKPNRDSFRVAQFLKDRGYRILPVNPRESSVLGEKAYAKLEDIPAEIQVDVVDVFRRPEETPDIAASAVKIGARALWLQLGIANEEAAAVAQAGGLDVVMDKCMKIEWEARNPG